MNDIRLIPMKCPSCGAQLDIPLDGVKVTCTCCGTPLVIGRTDAGLMLKPLTDSLAYVRMELNRASAALAVRRLADELEVVQKERTQFEVEANAAVSRRYAQIAQVKAKSSVANSVTIGAVAFLIILTMAQAIVDQITGVKNDFWVALVLGGVAGVWAAIYFYRLSETQRADKIAILQNTLNTEWSAAQRRVAADDLRINDMRAEMGRQQCIAEG